MLKEYDDALRTAAEIAAAADRDTRAKYPSRFGHEENYTPTFASKFEDRINGKTLDGVRWQVYTYTPKHSEEAEDGTDLLVGLWLKLGKSDPIRKGFRAQAKINMNKQRGLAVDSRAKLSSQCEMMIENSAASYVFAYGLQSTKIVQAQHVLACGPLALSHLETKSVFDFFHGFFRCDWGDFGIEVPDSRDPGDFARLYEARRVLIIAGRSADDDDATPMRAPKPPRPAERPEPRRFRVKRPS